MGDLVRILSAWTSDTDLSPDFVRMNVNSFADLSTFIATCNNNIDLAHSAVDAYAWDLFDKLHAFSVSGTILSAEDGHRAVQLLGAYVRPRELYIIAAEKMFSTSDPNTLQLLLTALEIVLQRSVESGLWTDVLRSVLGRTVMLCSAEEKDGGDGQDAAEDGVDQEDRPVEQQEAAQLAYVQGVLSFAEKAVGICDGADCGDQRREMLVGFLLDINGKIITALRSPSERAECLQTSASLILRVLPGGIMDVFEHIHRAKHAIFRHEMGQARKKFLAQYCHRTAETRKDLTAATALSTEDSNSLLNRIAMSENSAILIKYSAAAMNTDATSQGSARWWQALAQDAVTDDALAEALDCYGAESAGSAGAAGRVSAMHDVTCSRCSIPGIALFGLSLLRALDASAAVVDDTHQAHGVTAGGAHAVIVPAIVNTAQLMASLRPYALSLLRSPLATAEGLDLASRVLGGAGAGASATQGMRVFMPFLVQQSTQTALSHILLAFYNCLPALGRPTSSSASAGPADLFWSAQDAARLGALVAGANDTLAQAQTLITAMAQCADNTLRSAAFQCFRQYLKNIEERSLFGLLRMLIEQCPYPNMTGLLIDLAKECVQAAAAGASWSQARYRPGGSSAATGTAPGSWLQGSPHELKAQKSMLKKLFKPHSTATETTSAAPVAVDIDTLELFANKKRSAAAAAESPDAASEEEGVYLDLHSGKTSTITPEQLVEVREVLPFVWAGASPFWSPLMLRRLLLEPVRELALSGTVDKVLECADTVAAKVNLAQFVALKFLADEEFRSADADVAPTTGQTGAVSAYFAGTALVAEPTLPAGAYPFAYSRRRAVKDLFDLYYALRKVYALCKSASKKIAKESAGPAEVVRVQVLEMNAEHTVGQLHTVCQRLYDQLRACESV